ncbi:MAG: family 16 glycosylhydrolase [Chitinophagaceae bacterium]
MHKTKKNIVRKCSCILLFVFSTLYSTSQTAIDNFEGTGNIDTWFGDDCNIDRNFANPVQVGINTSSKVLRYADVGGQYANVRFDTKFSFNLATSSQFTLKLYVPSSGITGSVTNQISLKLQNGLLAAPWQTQCEIIKPIVLNQWQTITFDFATDPFINMNPGSLNPLARWDFNRVLIQINGENNNANVLAYIDDFLYSGALSTFNNLVWSDEFTGSGAVDAQKWFHQTQLPNGVSWYNNELQHYTNSTTNSFLSNGNLSIVAKRESFTSQAQTKQFTSARLNSKFAFKYGRVEVRAKLPVGAGTWPAIWMLGKNINEPGAFWYPTHGTTNWPACGEIDIMEHWGANQNVISSAVHFPVNGNLNAGQYVTNAQTNNTVSSEFHVYAVDWNAQRITFSVDGINHFSYNPSTKNIYTWPFDAEQYLLLNVAIEPRVTSGFVQSAMEVDYVRVYQQGSPLPLSFTNYNVALKGKKTIEHQWATTNEVNVDYFNVTQSTNGIEFLPIAKIKAKNEANNNYSFTELLANSITNTKLYYRLQSVDKDGKVKYSDIQQVRLNQPENEFTVYPNPSKNVLNISNATIGNTIMLTDINGIILYSTKVASSNFTINIGNLNSGLYILKTSEGQVHKVIKQ